MTRARRHPNEVPADWPPPAPAGTDVSQFVDTRPAPVTPEMQVIREHEARVRAWEAAIPEHAPPVRDAPPPSRDPQTARQERARETIEIPVNLLTAKQEAAARARLADLPPDPPGDPADEPRVWYLDDGTESPYGPVEREMRADFAEIPHITSRMSRTVIAAAYTAARTLDTGAGMATAAVLRELREYIKIIEGAAGDDPATAAHRSDLSTPV